MASRPQARSRETDVAATARSLEHEHRAADLALKQIDLKLRERALEMSDVELGLKQLDAKSSRWRSPVVVAVLAGAVAVAGNAAVALVNGLSQRSLEASRAESSLILEMVKTNGSTDRAAENLKFIIDAGLVHDPKRVLSIRNYLAARSPGTGVALSSNAAGADAQITWYARRQAGEDWARQQGVTKVEQCPVEKGPFRMGCLDWIAIQAS